MPEILKRSRGGDFFLMGEARKSDFGTKIANGALKIARNGSARGRCHFPHRGHRSPPRYKERIFIDGYDVGPDTQGVQRGLEIMDLRVLKDFDDTRCKT
jgi:hypothetical protein